jgi:hypothetical protein
VFDVTPEDILGLDDEALRELVGRLCEAELVSRRLSPVAVTWGGSQTAKDGGIDVRVALPEGTSIDGFVPRFSTGFQVKKPDMGAAKIALEMRPTGSIRAVIQGLVDEAGAYVIVSSAASVSASSLDRRCKAMCSALSDVDGADRLHLDFYDQTRLATAVRQHPGIIAWVRQKVGRSLPGWQPFGAWCGGVEGVDAEYLLDGALRLHLGHRMEEPARPVADAIDELRDELRQPGKVVRLVGLSGVGKTRFVQALFDDRVGSRALPRSLAVYTNLADDPDPQPVGMASDLLAHQMPVVLVVDNCPPDLHRRLSEQCTKPGSTVSVLTVEYDVREDELPENTQVVTLTTASPDLIEKLLSRRFPHLSSVDSRTIADASGGNARIAVALADTVERTGTVAGLSGGELFDRLFWQRSAPDEGLRRAAQVCALVYSFDGEGAEPGSELARLAELAELSVPAVYRHVGELKRRDLVQKRGVWRAVLPHALANHLAGRALEDIPLSTIERLLVTDGTERLARSFSRRLSFLHRHPKAVELAKRWLAPDGLLGKIADLDEFGVKRAMFTNIAPVSMEATLAALERVERDRTSDDAAKTWRRHRGLLCSIAYAPEFFDRCARLLVQATVSIREGDRFDDPKGVFLPLFSLGLSGTHASLEQRLRFIESLLKDPNKSRQEIGISALDRALQTNFRSAQKYVFGARSRDYGYQPRGDLEVAHWYATTLGFIERLVLKEGVLVEALRDLVVDRFRNLCWIPGLMEELDQFMRQLATSGFWCAGWLAVRDTLKFDKGALSPEVSGCLERLASDLRPSCLSDEVRVVASGDRAGRFYLEDLVDDEDSDGESDRLNQLALTLAEQVLHDESVFSAVLPDLLYEGTRVSYFGQGFAQAASDHRVVWDRMVAEFGRIDPLQRSSRLLRGFLHRLWELDREKAEELLDAAAECPVLQDELPTLHVAGTLEGRGFDRLVRVLRAGTVSALQFRNLALWKVTDHLTGNQMKDLLLLLADKPDGLDVALQVLDERLRSDLVAQRLPDADLLDAGIHLVHRSTFENSNGNEDRRLARIVNTCLAGAEGEQAAVAAVVRLRTAVDAGQAKLSSYSGVARSLLKLHPRGVLDVFLQGDTSGWWADALGYGHGYSTPSDGFLVDVVDPAELLAWCDKDPEWRYARGASVVTFANRPVSDGPKGWTEHAIALLRNAPVLQRVLGVFIKRFRPTSWSGSRAALIEENARLLDSLEPHVLSSLLPFVTETKTRLAQEIAQERKRETERDRAQDERFE